MLAPISWPLPPSGYGPWEQVVSNLTEELVKLGHEVTLFAAGGTRTAAKLVETCPHALSTWPESERNRPHGYDPETGLLEGPPDPRVWEQLHIATCMERAIAGDFDVVHSHLHVHALVYGRVLPCPLVSTLHGAAWVRAAHPVLMAYRDLPFVSLSNAERQLAPELNYVAMVHNGIRVDEFPFSPDREDFLLFAGRLAPEKGPAEAIQVAEMANCRLLLAGVLEPQHEEYFRSRIQPHLSPGRIEYLGPKPRTELAALYRKAKGVILMTAWCEPFGLVAAEAQASGAPLIATRLGALPEILRDGETGFLVDSVEEAAAAARRLDEIDPRACRQNAESRFSTAHMARGYEAVYRSLVQESKPAMRVPAPH
jgi:glycosyltransferase involved in cell wall biosynthesis